MSRRCASTGGVDAAVRAEGSKVDDRHIPLKEYSFYANAFDPRRAAILLVGGDERGYDRWYEINVPIADRLYDQHLKELKGEGKKEASDG